MAFAEGYHRVLHDDAPLSPELDKQTKTAIMDAIEDKDARRVYRQALAHANSQTLRDRLDRLCERTLETIAWELDVPNFCAAMVHTRNWMVHWGQRGQQAVEDPAALVMLLERLRLMLYVNPMLDIGLTAEEIARGISSGWRHERLP